MIDFLKLPSFNSEKGALSFVEHPGVLPFALKRAFWITGWPPGTERGKHAHLHVHQAFFVLQGWVRFTVESPTGATQIIEISSPDTGLYTPPMHWVAMRNEGHNPAVVLCLCSDTHDENEYIRDYSEFKNLSRGAV